MLGPRRLDPTDDERRHLFLGVRVENDERVLHAPVGRVGDVRDARVAVEADVVAPRVARERTQHLLAQRGGVVEELCEAVDRGMRGFDEPRDLRVALRVLRRAFLAPLLDFAQAVMQCVDQRAAPLRIVEQVVLQVRIALHDPDVAQHLVQHPGRPARTTLCTQLIEDLPDRCAEQPDDDFPIRERCVVVGDFAQARGRIGDGLALRLDGIERERQVQQG